MFVVKRNGDKQEVDFNKVNTRIKWLVNEPYELDIKASELARDVIQNLHDGIHTSKIDDYTANLASTKSIEHRDYAILAGRIVINNCHKNTFNSFKDKMELLYMRKDGNGNVCPLIDANFYKFVEKNQNYIENIIQYDRDYYCDFFGFRTLEKGYLLRIGDKIIERPQDLYMRVSIAIHMDTSDYKSKMALERIKETYDLMSEKYFIHATPTLFNAGTVNPALASCFLLGTEDSLQGIMKTATDCADISKKAGGIGFHLSNWRGEGALIRSTNGKSSGIVPFLRIFNDVARAFNQGGKRLGSFSAYLEPHHPDILKFLNLRKANGEENLRTRDLFIALWISDLFMERVRDNGIWHTFDPDRCPGLNDCYGDKYKELYLKYENDKLYTGEYKAREIFHAIFVSQKESGLPYMLYKDNVNNYNNQSNMGIIKSSNLCCEITIYSDEKEYGTCFTGDTPVLTKNGYKRIDECSNLEVLSCYNNDIDLEHKHSFVKAKLIKNGIKKVYNLKLNGLECIRSTFDHLYLTENLEWKQLSYLKEGDKINFPKLPILPGYNVPKETLYDYDKYLAIGWILGTGLIYTGENNIKFCSISFSPQDISIQSKVINAIISINDTNDWTCEKSIPYIWGTSDQSIIYHLEKEYGITDTLPHKKTLPDQILNLKSRKISSILSGLFSSCGTFDEKIRLFSISSKFLYSIQKLLARFGIRSLVNCTDINNGEWELNIKDYISIKRFNKFIGFVTSIQKKIELFLDKNMYTIYENSNLSPNDFVTVEYISYYGEECVYDLNVPTSHNFIVNGVTVHNCHLASICLPKFVKDRWTDEDMKLPDNERRKLNDEFPENPFINYKELARVAGIVCRNLNNVIDKNLYPCEEAKRSSFRGRPIGIGVQGLADVMFKFKTPFDSELAKSINKKLFEAIYFGALSMSSELAKHEYKSIKNSNVDIRNLPKRFGSYPAFMENGGSNMSKGKFIWEKYGLDEDDLSGMFDWETLRGHIHNYGVRNSLLTALMPTASTSHINGNIECFEPITRNIYKRKVLSGEFVVINKYLIRDLIKMGLWTNDMVKYLMLNGGSVQDIDGLPEGFKKLYRTVWEISQKSIMDLAIDRQPFVDQAQSMNLFFSEYTFNKFMSSQMYAWKGGLKTGSYYIRTQPSVKPQSFTIKPDDAKKLKKFNVKLQDNIPIEEDEICLVCSA